MLDAVILGAGPAGCAAAYDLAAAGKQVLLLDRRSFPRAKACACGLTRKTLAALRYSVDAVVEHRSEEIVLQPATLDRSGDLHLRSRVHSSRGRSGGNQNVIAALAVRSRFDAFCLQRTLAAARQGGSISLRKIDTAVALRESANAVELDVQTAPGMTETLRARVLVGADGSNGVSRRLALRDAADAGGGWYQRGFALEATVPYAALPVPLPAGDRPRDLIFDFGPVPGGYGWMFPKGDHINIGIGVFAGGDGGSSGVTRRALAHYTRDKLGVELASLPADVVSGQHLGMGGHAYRPGGRVLLTGDAAGLVDALTGEGIHSAIVSGQAAAAAVLEAGPQAGAEEIASAYALHLAPLQQTLAFSARAAAAFYRQPRRGFRLMRVPLVSALILRTYTDGLPLSRTFITTVRWAAKLLAR